ncbi:N-acetylmuramoyl-L-alanine amidase [Clostridium lacusfryxellense]|uniref:N-acetylmuramoyl-L-alanine amidase n=1 Tax=Clostridium lacusfryxellense TaxID=205328 RepID=UPI001C0AE874|nr:N-acetylmuramoyl-L-alanine amidase [Clostridium lacusfryxellense]MBU3113107.1 N-acetylmuramoyl-L-alanine amidase [Clostridium lacusfryxellense]
MKNIFKGILFMILIFTFCIPMQKTVKAIDYTSIGSKKDVIVNKIWTLSFNNSLSLATINTKNIKVIDENNKYIDIKVSLGSNNKNIIVQPQKNYGYNKKYTLIVTKSVKYLTGKNLSKEVRMSFNTIISPPKPSKFIVCINAARGGSDNGGIGPTGLKEKDVNLDVALRLGKLLEKQNVQVVYTRKSNSVNWNSVNEIKQRLNVSNNAKADLLITISCNGDKSKTANGIETYYLNGSTKGKQLAQYIQLQLVGKTKAIDRGTKASSFNSLKLSNSPGVMATLGFITNKSEEGKLKTSVYKDKLALAFKDGIVKYISVNPKFASAPKDTNQGVIYVNDITTKYKVVLDAGHGGYDPGAIGPSGLKEKVVALAVTLKVGKILSKNGVEIVYTRTSDNISWSTNQTQNLKARTDISNIAKPNYFVSIHANSYSNTVAKGVETFYYSGGAAGEKLAQAVQSELVKETGRLNRKIKTAGFYVLKNVDATAILVETSFISNPEEEKLLATDVYQNKLAKAISVGILKNLGISNILY